MYCPKGTTQAKKRLELRAREKLQEDIRSRGFEPLIETLTYAWRDQFYGVATMAGAVNEHGGDGLLFV
jgi:hypothetical protein